MFRFLVIQLSSICILLVAGCQSATPTAPTPQASVTVPHPSGNEPPAPTPDNRTSAVSEVVGNTKLDRMLGGKSVRVPVKTQKKIYYEWNAGFSDIEHQLDRKYGKGVLDSADLLKQRGTDNNRLEDAFTGRMERKYKLTYTQLNEIVGHGQDNDWPIPPNLSESLRINLKLLRQQRSGN